MEGIGVPFIVFFTFGWIAWVILSSIRRYKIARLQSDVQMKLLDRIDSSQSVLAYAETEAGRNFLNSLVVETESAPHRSILSGVRAGIILIAMGIALVSLHSMVYGDGPQVCRFFGTLAIALGIGFELAALATYFLSQSFGLLKRDERA